MRASGRDRPFLAGRPGAFAGTGRAVRRPFPRGTLLVQVPRGPAHKRPWTAVWGSVHEAFIANPFQGGTAAQGWGARARRIGGAAEQERGRGGTGAFSAEEGRLRPRHVSIWQSGDGQIGRPRVPCSVRVSSRTCGDVWFRQGPDTGEREPRLPSGLVKKVAKRSTWQPPVDSRPRCLGSKVSVEATSASWVVEASLSEAAIRTSVT